jgi:hypothetical protein
MKTILPNCRPAGGRDDRIACAFLCGLVSVHQRRTAENILDYPIQSLTPCAEVMARVLRARFTAGNPFADDSEHATEKKRLASLKFAECVAVMKAGTFANPTNAGAVCQVYRAFKSVAGNLKDEFFWIN